MFIRSLWGDRALIQAQSKLCNNCQAV